MENGWDQIQRLESSKYVKREEIEMEEDEKPRFLTGFLGKTELYEGSVSFKRLRLRLCRFLRY